MSLQGTIVNMAQTFVASNNINLLTPAGQVGTRRMGGKDAASARYIFTRLEKIARAIFHPNDDDLLNYLNDDGQVVEPDFYMPVIPMILVNGSDGIGTGWSNRLAASHNTAQHNTTNTAAQHKLTQFQFYSCSPRFARPLGAACRCSTPGTSSTT